MLSKNNVILKNQLQHFVSIPIINLASEIFSFQPFQLKLTTSQQQQDFKLPDIILGKQAEAIFEYILNTSPDYKILAANTQVQKGKITIGELDYLIKDLQTQQYLHIEVACKFYLFDDTVNHIYEGKWIGPNRKDTLLDKLEKLATKQFPLLNQKELGSFLNERQLKASQFKQKHYILSSLYIPESMDIKTFPVAYKNCIVGTWLSLKNFKPDANSRYALPSKKEWLLPENEITLDLNAKEVFSKVSESIAKKRAVQVYEMKDGLMKKYFVVWW